MSLKARVLKAGAQVVAGQMLQQALLLARNIMVARLLPPEQFGVALTFITIISALDSISELGIELFLIRSPNIEDPTLQNTLHSLLIMRGLISATAIFLLAHPISLLFSSEDAVWAYRGLAAVPLLRGFTHLDSRRYERELRYRPGLTIRTVSALVGLGVAVAVAVATRSHGAILLSYIVQTAVFVIGSHIVAQRPYRLEFNAPYRRELMAYGAPLMANSVFLFLLAQGDRLLVGSAFGVRELANYGVVVVLTGGTTLLLIKSTGTIYMPILANHKPGSPDFEKRYEICGAITASLALLTAIGYWTLGQPIVHFIYGEKYLVTPMLVGILGTQAAFKIFRHWQQVGFLTIGNTKSLLVTNVVSAAGLAFAAVGIFYQKDIMTVAACVTLGEILAAIVSISADRSASPGITSLRTRFLAIIASVSIMLFALHEFDHFPSGAAASALIFIAASAAGLGLILATAGSFRRFLLGLRGSP